METVNRSKKQIRFLANELKTRAEEGSPDRYIEGYFAVYGQETELWRGVFEEIAPGAFDSAISGDVRALNNHNTDIVLGRTKARTLELKSDSFGLWGRITINPDDTDAMNLYRRIQRGDVDQCSFGFDIGKEEADWRDDGTVKFTITEIDPLYEVSPCTFPAYEGTIAKVGLEARKAQVDEHRQRVLEARKSKLKERLQKDA